MNARASRHQAETLETIKEIPWSIEAEQSVLGGLMLDQSKWAQVDAMLVESDFYREDHRLIYRAIKAVLTSGHEPDLLVLNDYLKSQSLLEEAGGFAYLARMASDTPSAANILAYVEIVRNRSLLRQVIENSNANSDGAHLKGADPRQILKESMERLSNISSRLNRGKRTWNSAKSGLSKTLDRMQELSKMGDGALLGLSSGLAELDRLIGGFEKAMLYIVAGRPGMGKSTLAFLAAINAALEGKLVAVFSLEMPEEPFWQKIQCAVARVDFDLIRNPSKMEQEHWAQVANAIKKLANTDLVIDFTNGISPSEIRARLNQLEAEKGRPVDMVVVDYLQIMSVDNETSGMNDTARVTRISNAFMDLKKEFNCPFIVLSQLNRSLEQRMNKRPVISDLRESGAIEQDADVIMFIYRDEVYDKETVDKGIAEIIAAKNRYGESNKTARVVFNGKHQRFDDLDVRYA